MSNSPSQESTGIPFKKRDFAGKKLPVLSAKAMPINTNYDDFFHKNMKLDDLRKRAYYDVLRAFTAESSAISSLNITILEDLKKEWKIAYRTHATLENKLNTDPLIQQLRQISLASDFMEKQKVSPTVKNLLQYEKNLHIPSATMQKEQAILSSASGDSPIQGWGQVSPASLVDTWISIRLPGEDDYVPFFIKDYDAKTELHRLVTALTKKDFVDPCDWIDLRHFPAQDIAWQEGHPGFPTRECFLKPGETILHPTSTARRSKQVKEVGKTASRIPIISKRDKGKSTA